MAGASVPRGCTWAPGPAPSPVVLQLVPSPLSVSVSSSVQGPFHYGAHEVLWKRDTVLSGRHTAQPPGISLNFSCDCLLMRLSLEPHFMEFLFFLLFMTESKSVLKYHSLHSHLRSVPGNPVSAISRLPAHSISTSALEALR